MQNPAHHIMGSSSFCKQTKKRVLTHNRKSDEQRPEVVAEEHREEEQDGREAEQDATLEDWPVRLRLLHQRACRQTQRRCQRRQTES